MGPPVAPLQRPARREDPRQTTLRAHSHMMHRCKGLIAGTVLSIMRAAACAQLRRRSSREWDAPRDVLGSVVWPLFSPLFFRICQTKEEKKGRSEFSFAISHHVVECLLHAMMLATVPMAAMSVALE